MDHRYFFKTKLDDDPSLVVYQELIDDSEVLPLWENKLVGIGRMVE
jgi:hypothetical protein